MRPLIPTLMWSSRTTEAAGAKNSLLGVQDLRIYPPGNFRIPTWFIRFPFEAEQEICPTGSRLEGAVGRNNLSPDTV